MLLMDITAGQSVDDVMRRWPATIAVFIRHRMACVGCAIGPYHSVADASAEYGFDVSAFLDELRAAAGTS
jgi:hybrid cluster-associated redox disulfide protein